jgi:hypothetical protein
VPPWLVPLAAVAVAQPTCDEPMHRAELERGFSGLETSLDEVDVAAAGARLRALGDRLPCFVEPVDRVTFALFARYAALHWFLRQDEEQTRRWLQASLWAEPGLDWDPARFPPGHPLRRWADQTSLPPSGDGSTSHFVTPPGGGVVVGGYLLPRPEVPAGLPVVVQVFDGDGRWLDGFWQDGNAFPDPLVDDGPGEQLAPAWWWRPAGLEPVRESSPVPVVPVVAGAALLSASALTYALAGSTAASLAELDTSPELTAARGRANALVLVSAVALAGGLGVGVGGTLLGSQGLTVRF